MSRAKFRAGIPTVKPIVKSTKSSKTSKQQISHVQKRNRDQLPLSASTLSPQMQLDDPNRIPLPQKPRFPKIRVRKPAGIDKRLVKVPKVVVQPDDPHSLKVALIGAANAGKSTIVNKLIGEEVSGVSPKAHTTRERVLAILSEDKYQIVFLDTPGVIPDNNHAKMNRTLATSSWRSLDEAEHSKIVYLWLLLMPSERFNHKPVKQKNLY
ncbi:MAG: P-loop containing nucleoside triphosphate hydrolase protein [Benjaminiella poitrasii]|nr:MAG: P-loop containing nucleoside triphosphate hydrolase protein [Benjaminiella poitrasii]